MARKTSQAQGLDFASLSKIITLYMHLDLMVNGFIVAIAMGLTTRGVGVNPVSGHLNNHVFAPEDREVGAVEALDGLAMEMMTVADGEAWP
jgi:hypothetical protein